MTTIGWLFILAAIFLIQAALRGQIFDDSGKFVLLDNLDQVFTGLVTGDNTKLDNLTSGELAPTTAPTLANTATGTPDGNTDAPSGTSGPTPRVWARNPRTVDEMLVWCAKQSKSGAPIYWRRCLAFCANAYGLPYSGTMYAIDIWSQTRADMRHTSKTDIPTGALLLYRTGSRAGHIAIYAGGGKVYSTDIKRRGRIDLVNFGDLLGGIWRLSWVGWTPPYFPHNNNSKPVTND